MANHVDKIRIILNGSDEFWRNLFEPFEDSQNGEINWLAIDELKCDIVAAVGDSPNVEKIRLVAEELKLPDFALQVCLYAPFWIRSPQTWDKNCGTNLLEHLFVRYDVPEFLYGEWFKKSSFNTFKWFCWFILLGQGGSLKRAARLFKWNIPDRFSQHLMDAPRYSSSVEACIFAKVKQLGGTYTEITRLLIPFTNRNCALESPMNFSLSLRWESLKLATN